MKHSILILFVIMLDTLCSQNASDYFPPSAVYKWNYRLLILDSLNNQVPDLLFYEVDSLTFLSEYQGKEAYHISSKTGTSETISLLPYTNINYVHLSGSEGYEYNNFFELEFLINLLDSSSFQFGDILQTFSGWYAYYKFAEGVNQDYDIATIDNTVEFDSVEVPLRFSSTGRRLPDQNLSTGIGIYLCKKFLITNSINYLLSFPPFPDIEIPILSTQDTVWIAPGNWIVKNTIPSTIIDLTLFNGMSYTIPGLRREIISEVTGIKEKKLKDDFTFSLEQNYPNPFNPSTKIKFQLFESGFAKLKVVDPLGRIIDILYDEKLGQGIYEVFFDGSDLSTGTYFCVLEFLDYNSKSNFRIVKKMLFIK